MKSSVKITLAVGSMIGLICLCSVITEGPGNLSNKQRYITKPGQPGAYTLSDFKKALLAAHVKDIPTLVDMELKGHILEMPSGEEVVVLTKEKEYVELRFVHRTTHPDVWAHKESIEMKR